MSIDLSGACVGVDIGGTGTRLVCTVHGQVIGEQLVLTRDLGRGPAPKRVGALALAIRGLVPVTAPLAAVGLGASGPVHPVTGEIHNEATLPRFSGIELRRRLEQTLGVPVCIDNDAVAAAIGEWAGCEAPPSRLLVITLGTGIGGCLLVRGAPFRTALGAHPEIGHLPVFGGDQACYCGLRGCWEPEASRAALQAELARLLDVKAEPAHILRLAASRAPHVEEIRVCFNEYGRRVGRGLACLQLVYGPSLIVLGGGAGEYFPLFRAGMEQEFGQHPDYCPPPVVMASRLGERAGAVGAAVMAERTLQDRAHAQTACAPSGDLRP